PDEEPGAGVSGREGGGAAMLLARAEAELDAARGVDPALDAIADRVASLAIELGDLASSAREYLETIELEPGRLEAVEERLGALDRLKRKHGGSIEEVLDHAERCRAEIERLANAGEVAEELELRLAKASRQRAGLAAELSAGRRRAAGELESRVAAELAELAMDGAELEVALEPLDAGDYGPGGAETVELRVATNPGMPVSPLRDAASGGELSRIMLALTGLGQGEATETLVFDEIDAGVGGNTARAVGARLRRLGEARQLICITHLAQVASLASTHFRIEKQTVEGEARATVERVVGEELVAEIARMLGGERGDRAASRHAKELLKAA
ncbi:MAG: DNA repair protein RecN, partial [Solirubrobacterales bacterium]